MLGCAHVTASAGDYRGSGVRLARRCVDVAAEFSGQVGLFIGVLLSLADAVITKSYAPILGLGAAGGALIGLLVQRFGR
jgi:hypothetical protein